MADISMCLGRLCGGRESCYRHRATPEENDQSWGTFDHEPTTTSQCKFFWPIDKAEGPLDGSDKELDGGL